jgi:hypothetical protein
VAAEPLAQIIDTVTTVEGSGVKGHVPVQAAFRPRPVALKALTIRRPPDIPLDRIHGPLPPPQDWTDVTAAANAVVSAITRGAAAARVQRLLDDAYYRWCQKAEIEVADATGGEPRKWGLRGRLPRLTWASVLPEDRPREGQSCEAKATWLRGFANELCRLGGVLGAEAGSGLFASHLPAGLNRPHGATFATPVRGGYGTGAAVRNGTAAGGRPRQKTQLSDCEEVAEEIITELEGSRPANEGAGEACASATESGGEDIGFDIMHYVNRTMGIAIRTNGGSAES